MPTRRQGISVRAYDYLHGLNLVVARLHERGEAVLKLDRHGMDSVSLTVEVCAEQGFTNEQAEAAMRDLADRFITDRGRTLFSPFDSRDNMGDETVVPDQEHAA